MVVVPANLSRLFGRFHKEGNRFYRLFPCQLVLLHNVTGQFTIIGLFPVLKENFPGRRTGDAGGFIDFSRTMAYGKST